MSHFDNPIISNNKMKQNNSITLLLLLLCFFTLGPCACTAHNSNDETIPETTQAYAPDSAFGFPTSESPYAAPTWEDEDTSKDSSKSDTSFSSAFADILKGSLGGNTMTIPENTHDNDNDETNTDDNNNNNNNMELPNNNHQAVRKICSHTDYPDICFTTISPLVPRRHFDFVQVLEASIKACYLQTNFTISTVLKHMSASPEMATALSDCKEQYSDALENLKRAIDAIPSRDFGTVTVMLSAVMADVSACESGFQDLKAASPIGNSEGLVSITTSNCLAIASLISY